MPSLLIKHAILHVLLNDGRPSVYSESELDIDSEVCEAFIAKHAKKLMGNLSARQAVFKPDAEMYTLLSEYKTGTPFKETARIIAERLNGLMQKHVDIPPADLLIARLETKKGSFLAIVKLNFSECITHVVRAEDGDAADNQLVKYNAVLPFGSGKVEDACLIDLTGDAMPLALVEKPRVIDGESVLYFSELFLACETAPSVKETARTVDEVTEEIVQTYFQNDPSVTAKIKTVLMEEADNGEGYVSMDDVAVKAFAEHDEAKQQYIKTLREAGIREDVPFTARFARQQFGTQRIKAENGVEIKFPAELAAEGGDMEITRHPDGTVTVVFNRLRMA